MELHGVPVPDWLQQLRPGDPVEVTIRGIIDTVICDSANGPDHLVLCINYGDRHLHPPGPPLCVVIPAEPGVTIKSFAVLPG